MSLFADTKLKYLQKGMVDRVKYLDNLHNVILPSFIKKIQQNDKTVLKEVVLPEWLNWDLLFDWASQIKIENGKRCTLCGNGNEVGILFKEKWICDECLLRLKDV